MTLSGNKIKKYLIITCPNCLESYEVDWKDILDSPVGVKTIMCPWCEHECDFAPAIMEPTYRIVRVDQTMIVRADKQAMATIIYNYMVGIRLDEELVLKTSNM